MIYIHPTVSSSPARLAQLQLQTGLRAVPAGRRAMLIKP